MQSQGFSNYSYPSLDGLVRKKRRLFGLGAGLRWLRKMCKEWSEISSQSCGGNASLLLSPRKGSIPPTTQLPSSNKLTDPKQAKETNCELYQIFWTKEGAETPHRWTEHRISQRRKITVDKYARYWFHSTKNEWCILNFLYIKVFSGFIRLFSFKYY